MCLMCALAQLEGCRCPLCLEKVARLKSQRSRSLLNPQVGVKYETTIDLLLSTVLISSSRTQGWRHSCSMGYVYCHGIQSRYHYRGDYCLRPLQDSWHQNCSCPFLISHVALADS